MIDIDRRKASYKTESNESNLDWARGVWIPNEGQIMQQKAV